jgi:hypothetical protein
MSFETKTLVEIMEIGPGYAKDIELYLVLSKYKTLKARYNF